MSFAAFELIMIGGICMAVVVVLLWLLRSSSSSMKIGAVCVAVIAVLSAISIVATSAKDQRTEERVSAAHQRVAEERAAAEESEAAAKRVLEERRAANAEQMRTGTHWLGRNLPKQLPPNGSAYVVHTVEFPSIIAIEAVEVMGSPIAIEVRLDGELVCSSGGEKPKVTLETTPLKGVISVTILNKHPSNPADIRYSISSKGV